jgi:outer membrane protein OmpA-like peptidoglycan-associated protein
MKRVKLLTATLALTLVFGAAKAQGVLNRLGDAAQRAAERAATRQVERRTEQAIDEAIDRTLDGAGNSNRNNRQQRQDNNQQGNNPANAGNAGGAAAQGGAQQSQQSLEMTYAKNDFVPGDEIIFEDDQAGERMGEFPSMWDLIYGNAEVANIGGVKAIFLEAGSETTIAPLMKNMQSYLPDVFTLEFDYWVNSYTETHQMPSQNYRLELYGADGRQVMHLEFAEGRVGWSYRTPDGDDRNGNLDRKEKIDSWNHLSVSFNKRAFKAYINGERVVNIPSMAAPVRFSIRNTSWREHRTAITNVRLAQGAVPLYDRMLSDGKFITYGITFDVGKSTIKPESMGEINRIVQLMTENPTLKFSVEGHTDSTGNAASNQTLSEARSQAVVDKLVENGVARDRLTAAGKGQSSPIADNSTDEGRAKNRRVEFVKQ